MNAEPEIKWRMCVFCGSSSGSRPGYKEQAFALGKAMAEAGIGLVYGGGDLGVMGAIAHGVFENGGSVVGVIPQASAGDGGFFFDPGLTPALFSRVCTRW